MQGLACSRGLSYLEMFEVHIQHGFTSGEILAARICNGARFFDPQRRSPFRTPAAIAIILSVFLLNTNAMTNRM
jgi:hypothetical protein